jgi:hypothetical protein
MLFIREVEKIETITWSDKFPLQSYVHVTSLYIYMVIKHQDFKYITKQEPSKILNYSKLMVVIICI